MASSLAAQLAKIKATGPNPLDLKSQKSAHSQSLLFDSQTAATQNFDVLFLLCYEGFEELCNLDARFIDFANNIFSQQSKHEDRNLMTALQNSQLDVVLEHFLALVGGKLLLKPAQKAVEWLIRRFRVHQNNTLCLVLTFLPYHASPIFTTLLSILPQNLPATLKFLHPYIKSQANPPRRVLVYAATNNVAFLARLNARVLAVCKSGHHYPALLSFWASMFAEAVAAIIDLSCSGRQEAQIQKREDLMYRIIPTLSEGLKMNKAPDLQVGCYMVFTVATLKLSINEKTSTAFMNTVTLNLSKTKETGIIFLAALAQQMDTIRLPEQVFKSLLRMEGLVEILINLHRQYKLDCVALGIVLGILQDYKALDIHRLGLVSSLAKPNLMHHSYITIAAIALISVLQKPFQDIALKNSTEDLLRKLFEDRNLVADVRDALKNKTEELARLEPKVQNIIHAEHVGPLLSRYDKDMENVTSTEAVDTFNDAIRQISITKENEPGFLSRQESPLFDTLAKNFMIAYPSEHNLKVFPKLGVLHKFEALNEPLFLSFYIRFWCGNHAPKYRTAAINSFSEQVKDGIQSTHLQLVIPYILYGLSDSSSLVRHASIELVRLLRNAYSGKEKVESNRKSEETGRDKIYGQDESAHTLIWLSREEACKFMEIILLSRIEECLIDPDFISQFLSDVLSDSNRSKNPHTGGKELKTGIRRNFFAYLSSHVVNTPLYAVKLRLLRMLNRIEQAGKLSRNKALLPLICESIRWNPRNFVEICSLDMIDPSELLHQIFRIVQPNDQSGIQILKDTIKPENRKSSSFILTAAYERIRNIWGSLRSDLQSSLATIILDRAMSDESSKISEEDHQALITLRTVSLSTTVLQSLLESCVKFASSLSAIPQASKRRKISHEPEVNSVDSSADGAVLAIRKLTLVCELIEACGPKKHSQLLKGLFQVLEQLHLHRNVSGTDMVYVQVLVMESILAILEAVKESPSLQIDQSTFQPNLIVESVRTTTNTQIQHVGLLVLSALAHVTPKLVLHSVIPIFTFMNETILRQSDDYSAYVVSQIMESVIPVLAKSLKEQEKDPIHGISELLLSFVAAFDHIPSQRRLGLFKSLTDKIGSAEFLFIVPISFSDKYPGNGQIMQFVTSLCIEKYLGVILDISKTRHSFSKYSVAISKERDFSSVVGEYLPFVAIFLETPDLALKVRNCFDQKDNSSIRVLYERIINHLLVISNIIRNNQSENKLIGQLSESLLNLISTSNLIEILKNFLETAQDDIRCQMLKSFQRRLNNHPIDHKTAQSACIGLLPLLTSIIRGAAHSSLKHACLSAINTIIRRYGKMNVAAVELASDTVASENVLEAPEVELRIASLNCLASMVEVLRDAIIPVLPTLIPKALDQINISIRKDAESGDLFEAAYSFFYALLLCIPWTISHLHLERILNVSYKSVHLQLESRCYQQCQKTLRLAASQVEPQGFLRVLSVTWMSALKEGSAAIGIHLELLRAAIERQPKSSIVENHLIITDIFIKAFDIRNLRFSIDTDDVLRESEIEEIENAIVDSAIAMVYKLNDTIFRPMFLKVWEWTESTSYKSKNGVWFRRKTTFYAFVAKFFQSFRSIVTSYAAFIIGDSINILNDISFKDDKSVILWKRVVLSLCQAFEHDQDNFWQSPSHFSPIADSLLAQFNHASLLPMTSEIIPAITELAASANSIDHLKVLNKAILKHMRSEHAYIRLAAVQCEYSLTDRLGEEWLTNLPEMLPFINELQEDDDEFVVIELRHWVVKIESILGESVNSMLR